MAFEGKINRAISSAQLETKGRVALKTEGDTFRSDSLNLEGATMSNGELNTGALGEGFVDRRHPHTYLHEGVLSVLGESVADLAQLGSVEDVRRTDLRCVPELGCEGLDLGGEAQRGR